MSHSLSEINVSSGAIFRTPSKTELPPLVLIVDDDSDTRELYRFLFESKGLRVMEAEDGERGVCLAQTARPDLILMDTSMPHVDGLSATLRIRSLEGLRTVPIIFLSGHAQPLARTKALASGGNDYLIKPVELDKLEVAVERQLGNRRARTELVGIMKGIFTSERG